jgi:hypothetical protein
MDDEVTVYRVRYWNNSAGEYTYPDKMRTLEFAKRTNGMSIIEDSAIKVKRSALDEQGGYVPPKSP